MHTKVNESRTMVSNVQCSNEVVGQMCRSWLCNFCSGLLARGIAWSICSLFSHSVSRWKMTLFWQVQMGMHPKKSQNQVSIRDSPAKAAILERQFQDQTESWLINFCPLVCSVKNIIMVWLKWFYGSTRAFFCGGSTRRCSSRTTAPWLTKPLDLQESGWVVLAV